MSERAVKAQDAVGTGGTPNDSWLAKHAAEDILDPQLPIVDPHHHLWDRARPPLPARRAAGRYRQRPPRAWPRCSSTAWPSTAHDGPAEMRPIGETEFANGVAAMAASGAYGPTRACAAIVGHADLLRGAAAREVLRGASAGRQRALPRHSPCRRLGRQPADPQQPHQPAAGPVRPAGVPRGLRAAGAARPVVRGLAVPPAAADGDRPGARLPGHLDHPQPCRRPAGHRPLCRPGRDEVFASWTRDMHALARCPNVMREARRPGHADRPGFDFAPARVPPTSQRARRGLAALDRAPASRPSARRAACSRATSRSTSSRLSYAVLWNAFKRLAAGASAAEREDLVQRHRAARVPPVSVSAAGCADRGPVVTVESDEIRRGQRR